MPTGLILYPLHSEVFAAESRRALLSRKRNAYDKTNLPFLFSLLRNNAHHITQRTKTLLMFTNM